MPTSALLIHFKDYEQFHNSRGNKLTHMVGIPGVLFSLLGLFSYVHLGSELDLGIVLVVFGCLYALKMDVKLGIPFTLFIVLNYLLARHLSLPVLFAIQVISWILQFWGHFVYEKKAPAFLKNLESFFIGPMWIFAFWIGYYKPAK